MTTEAPSTSDTPHEHDAGAGDNSAGNAMGEDPAVLTSNKDKKLTGTGQPGSHSALFGLTPDGHREKDADYGGAGGSASTGETTEEDATATSSGDTGSRAPEGGGVKEQLHDPRVAEKAHGGDGVGTEDAAGKPGAGSSSVGPSQGTGEV